MKAFGWRVAFATSLLLMLAAFSKAVMGGNDVYQLIQVALEATLAIVATKFWTNRLVQLGFVCLFLSFASYIVYASLVKNAESCGCFAEVLSLPSWAIFAVDIVFAFAWFNVYSKRAVKLGGILKISFIALTASAFFLSAKTLLSNRAYRVALEQQFLMFKDADSQLIQDASAIYFLKTRCGNCVAGLTKFEDYCELKSLRYVVAVGTDALPLPDIKGKVVVFPTSENHFNPDSPAHLIKGSHFVSELHFEESQSVK